MTAMTAPALRALIEAVATRLIAASDELTALDQAIGDGDHGLNLKRGFEAVLGQIDAIAAKPLPESLKAIGTTLIMKIGGASGPLYGTLFVTMGKTLPESPALADLAGALDAAIAAIRKLGKADVGMKTMLDVLVPVQIEIAAVSNAAAGPLAGSAQDAAQRIAECATRAADATAGLKAIRGRASFLGDRSIGHVDPGARSSAMIVTTVCKGLSG